MQGQFALLAARGQLDLQAKLVLQILLQGRDVGVVTSGTYSPTLGHGIALARLEVGIADGAEVAVDVRGTPVIHDVVGTPFVDRDPRR